LATWRKQKSLCLEKAGRNSTARTSWGRQKSKNTCDVLRLYFLLWRWYFSTNWWKCWFSDIYWHFRREFIYGGLCLNTLVTSGVFFRTITRPLWTVLCKLVSGKMSRVFQVSLNQQSPDINIIENIWTSIKGRVQKDIWNIKSRDDLIACVLKCRRELHSTYIQQRYESISRRIRCVV